VKLHLAAAFIYGRLTFYSADSRSRGNPLYCHTFGIRNLTEIDRSDKRQKGYGSGPFDCVGERSLMLGTTT